MMQEVQGLVFAVFHFAFHCYFILPLRYDVSLLRQVTFLSPILGMENVLVRCCSRLFGFIEKWLS